MAVTGNLKVLDNKFGSRRASALRDLFFACFVPPVFSTLPQSSARVFQRA